MPATSLPWSATPAAGDCRFLLLGPFGLTGPDGRPRHVEGAKARAVLALLLLELNRAVPADVLIDALWGERPPRSARGTLQAHISRLRAVLRSVGDGELVGRHGSYLLHGDPDTVDAGRFEVLVDRARHLSSPGERAAALEQALALRRGPALADLRHHDALAPAAERLDELGTVAVEEHIDAELAAGGHVRVIARLHELVDHHPYRERLHGQLMLALHRSGRQAEALRAYQRAYRVLGEEVGVVPSAALRDLERAIAAQDPALDLRTSAPAAAGVDRDRAIPTELAAAWRDALGGRRRLAVAPPGPLAAFVAEAGGSGALVIDIALDDRAVTGPFGAVTAALLRAGLGPVPLPATSGDPGSERYLFFEAVIEQLQRAASTRPVVLVLRALHEASRSTLLLVEHLVRHRDRAPLLPVAVTVGHGGPVGALLLRLQRDDLVALVPDAPDGQPPPGPFEEVPAAPVSYRERAATALRLAVHLAGQAGDAALAQLGFDEAADHYHAALDTLALAAPGDHRQRAHLLIACGRAEHAAYLLPRSLATFRTAVSAAIAAGDDELLSEAAVGLANSTDARPGDRAGAGQRGEHDRAQRGEPHRRILGAGERGAVAERIGPAAPYRPLPGGVRVADGEIRSGVVAASAGVADAKGSRTERQRAPVMVAASWRDRRKVIADSWR